MTSKTESSAERHPISLQATIGISIGAVIVLCFLVLAAALGELAQREIRKFSQLHIDNLAQQMARELSGDMDKFASEIAVQASRNRFRSANPNVEQMRTALDEFKSAQPDFIWVGVIDDASARVVVSTGGIFEQGDVRGRPVYERGRQGPFVGDIHSAVQLAALLPKPADGEALRFLDAGAPIKDLQGKTIRVMSAHLNWEWTDRLRENLLGPPADRHGVEIMLVDVNGNLVLTPNRSFKIGTPVETLARDVLTMRSGMLRWSDGRNYLCATIPVSAQGHFPGFGWKVIARQSVADAVGPARTLRNGFFAGALVLGLVTAAIAWLLAGRLIRPVRELALSAMHTSLQSDGPAMPKSRIDEIARMQTELSRLTTEGRAFSRSSNVRELQFIAFADSMPELVWQADAKGKVLYANAQWLQLLGSFAGVGLDDLSAFAHPSDLDNLQQYWQRSKQSGADLSLPIRLALLPARSFEWYRLRGRAVRDAGGEIFGWVGTFSNINESVLRSQKTEKELGTEREARAEAERALRMKDDFLATLSHELRTPLNAISGWAQVLARRPDVDPFVSRAAGVISRNVAIQAALIGDLLDMSAVIGGELTLQLEAIDGAALVAEVVDSFKTAAAEKPLLLSRTIPRVPVMIMADPQRLRQILRNLLSNALKFTELGGKVHVAALVTSQHLVIKITDTGIGIAADFLPHIFDRFRQEDASSTRQRGGLGLGLALAKGLTDLHHGSIHASSEGYGRGTEVAVVLPLLETDAKIPENSHDPATESAVAARLDGMTVLLTDDEADARESVSALLTSLGATVQCAASAAQTLTALAERRFDLLLCDIAMPVTDGYTLIRQLRARPEGGLPAIALSAFAMQQDQLRAREAGFDAHLAKPVSAERLITAIRTVVKQR